MRLTELIDEFSGMDDREKLDFIVESSDELPPVSADRAAVSPPADCRVQECQTTVYLWVDVVADHVHLEADVPRNSPLVRGLVTLVIGMLEGLPSAEVLAMPEDLSKPLGLASALGMTRQQGLRGVMSRVHREVRRQKSGN